jgi:glycogen phosphorylase
MKMPDIKALFRLRGEKKQAEPQPVEDEKFFAQALLAKLQTFVPDVSRATAADYYRATADVILDRLLPVWGENAVQQDKSLQKEAAYISIEWLQGPNIYTALKATRHQDDILKALKSLGQNPDKILSMDIDPADGNGGLGRLASCFIDSTANQNLPVTGYGLIYKDGLFFQQIDDQGQQRELPQHWYSGAYPWIRDREDITYTVKMFRDNPIELKVGARDMIVPGYRGDRVNTLRFAETMLPEGFDSGNPEVNATVRRICDTLYPKDDDEAGKNLRLAQEYTLVSFSMQDLLRRHLEKYGTLDNLAEKVSIQINDTHPAMAIPELMRILTEEKGMDWEKAKDITRQVCNYTNHTLLPEALEKWHVGKMNYVVPAIANIVERLHNDLMNDAAAMPDEVKARISIRSGDEYRMGHMAAFYSNRVNGVSAMHTELVFKELFPDLTAVRGEDVKVNHTNGITPRRWLEEANPALAGLITNTLGNDNWVTGLRQIEGLRTYLQDPQFRNFFGAVKTGNKERLADLIKKETGIELDTNSLFDVQTKRIHEYKRQLMNILQTVALYQEMKENPDQSFPKVSKIIAGKAAPGYAVAKDIIALTNRLAKIINKDSSIKGQLKMAFIPNYDVEKAKTIVTGADLSQQISTAGKEASGTGNMKFMLNGALTIGTHDGANVEMGEAVGEENMFFFGKTKEEIDALKTGGYNPQEFIDKSPRLKKALAYLDEIGFGHLADTVRKTDTYCIAADFDAYWDTQKKAIDLYSNDPGAWLTKSMLNTIAAKRFSSDDTILGYARENWDVVPAEAPAAPALKVISTPGSRAPAAA